MIEDSNEKVQKNYWNAGIVVAIAGIVTSLYSINHHMKLKSAGHTAAACNINSAINCDAVAASKYSEFLGIPLGVWGLGYFLAVLVLAITVVMKHKSAKEHQPVWLLLSAIGVMTSIGLAGISLGILGTVCIVCIAIYILTLIQGTIAFNIWRTSRTDLDWSLKTLGGGGSSVAVIVAMAVLGFQTLKPNAELPSELQDLPGKHDGQSAGLPLFAPNSVEIPVNKSAFSGLGEDYRKGPDDAKIVIVEFADYMCPACGQAAPVLEELHRQLGNRALFVFKNFPLSSQCNSGVGSDMHPYSCDIVKLARCAGQNGKFWDYHTKAFGEQAKASKEKSREWGKEVGLTDQQMDQCLASADYLAKIKDDIEIANKLGVNSTPTIFMNGRKYLGDRTIESMRAAVESL